MRRGALALVAGLAAACAMTGGAEATPYKGYWFRVSHFELSATATAAGSETDYDGTTTSGSATRTATIDYHGHRGDLANFAELPRRGYPGSISVGRTVPMAIHQSGSWSQTWPDGSASGTCHGDKLLKPFEPYSQIHRDGRMLRGRFDAPIAGESFNDGCALNPDLGTPHFPWKLPASAFHRRVVKIRLSDDLAEAGGIHWESHWIGTVTLRRLAICRTSQCAARIR